MIELKFFDVFNSILILLFFFFFFEELCALMFSLDWIKAKTELVGPAHLIHEFVEYRHILDEKV